LTVDPRISRETSSIPMSPLKRMAVDILRIRIRLTQTKKTSVSKN